MNMKKLRLLTVLVAFALILAVTAGCTPTVTTTAPTTTQTPTTTEGTTAPTEIELPLTDTPVTFKMFVPVNRVEGDMANNAIWKEISERTGIQFEWESPISSAAAERLTLILTSQQYPDIISTTTGSGAKYPGGLEVAVDDGVFIDLKALVEENAPNYWAYLSSNPVALRDALTDKGYLPAIYEVTQKDTDLTVGLWSNVTRADWLEDLNLPVPETIDEWYTTLTAFKEEKGATFPLLWMLGKNPIWLQAWGVYSSPINASGSGGKDQFYPDAQGKIHYGAVEQGFEDYLTTFSKWYAEGLFDRDFTTRAPFELPVAATLFGTGQAGVTGGYLAWSGMYMSNATDPNFKIAVCPHPVLKKGDKATTIMNSPEFLGFNQWSITSQCENPELFVKLINWLSTEEGQLLTNYGIEGVQYNMVDGQPKFTDVILKDSMGAFDAREIINGIFNPVRLLGKENLIKQVYDQQTLDNAAIPSNSTSQMYLYYQLNEDEANELSEIFADIHTYVAEQNDLAIMDPAIAANWMEVQAEYIKGLDIDRCIEIVQGAYDRYLAKG